MANTQPGKFFKISIATFVIIVIVMLAKTVYEKQIQRRELFKQSSLLDKNIEEMQAKIEKVKQEIRLVKNDPNYLKHKAAENYLMIDKNESIIIFNGKK